jgi:acetyl-CoA carboxylase biotin carboxyl carrier protein
MDYKQIQELIKLINKSNIGELRIEEEGFKIVIKQKEEKVQQTGWGSQPVMQPAMYMQAPAQQAATQPQTTAETNTSEQLTTKTDNLITIKSPMIGTFYKRPTPDKPAFVEVGDEITPGKVVCIIEAMKLFNEIESEVSGKVVKILVEDSSPVEYDQPLFLIEP